MSGVAGADDLAAAYASLEKGASPATLVRIQQLVEQVKNQKLGFEVGVTAVSEKKLSDITGIPPLQAPTDADKETAAERSTIAKLNQQSERPSRTTSVASNRTTGTNGEPPQASYYSTNSSSRTAASWMDAKQFPLASTCSSSAKSWVSRDALPPIRSQDPCGSCWAFSAIAAVEISHAYKNGAFYDFSEQSVLDCAQTSLGSDAGTCKGGWYNDVFDFFGRAGPSQELAGPYVGKEGKCQKDKLSAYRRVSYGEVDPASPWGVANTQLVKDAICRYGAVAATVNATDLFQNYRSGVFTEPAASAAINHAITLVGWDDAKGAWLLRNSWALGWGEAGYMWIKYGSNGVGTRAFWVATGAGDAGTASEGSNIGAYYTREPWIRNSTGEPIALKVQYAGWTGSDGMKWLPQQGAWLNYSIPTGYFGPLASPFISSLRGARLLMSAQNASGKKTWKEYETTPLDLVPDGGYWAEAPQAVEIEITAAEIIPRSQGKAATVVAKGACKGWALKRVSYAASTAYEWDVGSAPDFTFAIDPANSSVKASVVANMFNAKWDFDPFAAQALAPGSAFTLRFYDVDALVNDDVDQIVGKLPSEASSGTYKVSSPWGEGEVAWVCVK
jgi:cathepsin L